ncbi:hypothetical protein [Streptomyces pactum]|uniref:hypothetical protein n=1 Tax=Streptomyces pactum TaxID=68249 RepID=UPI000AB82DCE|nr:hypothetical protein [Streptomyces pactum]
MRDGVGLLSIVVLVGAVLVFTIGGTRWFARASAPVFYDLPGGSWAAGGALGLVSVLGWAGAVSDWLHRPSAVRTGRLPRVARTIARGVCWVAAIGPVPFLFSGLQGKNCHSYESGCAYIPGAGPALLSYVGCVALLGWLCYRWRGAVAEEHRARERERLRKLREKGKGKSRAARQR